MATGVGMSNIQGCMLFHLRRGFLDTRGSKCTVSCVRWRIGGRSEPCHPHTHGLGPYMMGRFVARKKKVTITEVSGFNLYLAMGRDLVESVE